MLFCLVYLRWVFIKSVFVVGSEAGAICDIIIFKNIAFCRNYLSCLLCFVLGVFLIERFWIVCCGCFCDWFYDWLMRWFVVFVLKVCFLNVFDWVVAGIVFSDCLIWLIVPVGCFLLSGCDFVRKKKIMVGRCICIVAVVKPYVKMSAVWFKRLIFWFGRVLFVVKTLLCFERRFASGTS